MSKVKALVDVVVTVEVEIDSDKCLCPKTGPRKANPGENESFTEEQIERWLKEEFNLSVGCYETECEHGYVNVSVDNQSIDEQAVTIETFEE